LDFYNASSLKQQSAGRHVAPLGHIILIPSQPAFTNTNFIVFGLTRPWLTTGHHDIAEILLKVGLNTKNQIKSNVVCNRISGVVIRVLAPSAVDREKQQIPIL
jgi:hypothetical protein